MGLKSMHRFMHLPPCVIWTMFYSYICRTSVRIIMVWELSSLAAAMLVLG